MPRKHQIGDGWYVAWCAPCQCYTHLMVRARGTNKASRKNGVVVGMKCCRCKRVRAVTSTHSLD